MCYGCNIGPHIMPQIITGISYHQIKHMFDWQLTDDAHRMALALIVNGIGGVEVTRAWVKGKQQPETGNGSAITNIRFIGLSAINSMILPLSCISLSLISSIR